MARHSLAGWGRKPVVLAAWLLLAATLPGCVASPPSPTSTSVPPSPTETVAFPTLVPTNTSTPGPSPTPTLDLRDEVAGPLLFERFDDGANWTLGQSDSGGSSVEGGRLSLSVRQARAFQFVTRETDSYADVLIEVDVYTELCSPGDEFGLMFRVNGLGEHYRFLLGCDGAARASRALESGSRALTWWIPNPAILPASPVHNHVALLARGDTFRIFVNDEEILSVRDISLASGRLGLMARAGPSGQISVSFDDLAVYALNPPASSTATAGATPIP